MVTFWGAIKLYFQINMTKALILNVMPDTIMVKYVNYEILISLYDLKYSVRFNHIYIYVFDNFIEIKDTFSEDIHLSSLSKMI